MVARRWILSLVFGAVLVMVPEAHAAPLVDGALDAAYGPALATQTTQTSLGDASQGTVEFSAGSELDAGYGVIVDGVLHLFLSGNLMFQERGMEPGYRMDEVDVYIDSEAGGQNVLRADNPAVGGGYHKLNTRAGLRFDTGFEPDHWFNGLLSDVPQMQYPPPYVFKVHAARLPTGGGGGGGYLGQSSLGGPGTLSGGTNPDGVEAAADNRNTIGVTAGCDAASGAGVTTGVELAIPLAAIGDPTGCVRVCAFAVSYWDGSVSNQVLGPLPPGTCAPGAPATVDFSSQAGAQYFTVCPDGVPVRTSSWGSVKAIYR